MAQLLFHDYSPRQAFVQREVDRTKDPKETQPERGAIISFVWYSQCIIPRSEQHNFVLSPRNCTKLAQPTGEHQLRKLASSCVDGDVLSHMGCLTPKDNFCSICGLRDRRKRLSLYKQIKFKINISRKYLYFLIFYTICDTFNRNIFAYSILINFHQF